MIIAITIVENVLSAYRRYPLPGLNARKYVICHLLCGEITIAHKHNMLMGSHDPVNRGFFGGDSL